MHSSVHQKQRLFILFFLLSVFSLYAQGAGGQEAEEIRQGDLWVCLGAETAMYSLSSPAFGGAVSIGYGAGASIGFKAAFLVDAEGLFTSELNFLLRMYFAGQGSISGLFIQVCAGPAFFVPKDSSARVPAEYASISAGLGLGWRFLVGRNWFIEPLVRAGYPYITGIGVSAGFHY